MTFSLIVATYGRATELENLFESLASQTERDFEILVIDQNPDALLAPILAAHPELPIRRLSSERGLSRARNVGLSAATGDIIAFPDDDCRYPPDMLRHIAEAFRRRDVDGITTLARDDAGFPCGGARWDTEPGYITRRNIWRRAISIGVFLKADAARAVGGFDEGLGAGSGTAFGAGEETDYLLRILATGRRIYFEPSLFALHPALSRGESEADIRRAYNYGMGLGLVLRRHRYSLAFAATGWLRSAAGMALASLKMQRTRARFYRAAMLGKFGGWRAGGKE
ncbi:MAG: glycosyltransferase family 2 protein [Fimbriimonadaceae bacterium]